MPATISAFPHPRISQYFSPPGPFVGVLNRYTYLSSSGRAAIYWAFRGLGLPPGTVVTMPSYHCGAEVQAVLDAGLQVDFYGVLPDLSIDFDDLEKKLEQHRGPVFIIHYCGWGQPETRRIAKLCADFSVPWVEDCAHALFSESQGKPLGQDATIAIFSLRKTLPLFDGGAFEVDTQKYPVVIPDEPRASIPVLRSYMREAVRSTVGGRAMDSYLLFRQGGQPACEPTVWNAALQRREWYQKRLSAISFRVAAATNAEAVVAKRRNAWLALDAGLAGAIGYRKVFEYLPEGVCPLFLPIRVAQRDGFVSALREQQIETYVFGKYPHQNLDASKFAGTAALRNEILYLPVHQELRAEQIERMISVVRPLLAKYG